jgi:hypothetical protein
MEDRLHRKLRDEDKCVHCEHEAVTCDGWGEPLCRRCAGDYDPDPDPGLWTTGGWSSRQHTIVG